MEVDELSYNVFYLLLRNEYKKKYELALTKCWTICVPCGDSLREIAITKEFIDNHVLKPITESKLEFISTDENQTHLYKVENGMMKLNNDESAGNYQVNILSVEKGYNREFQPYNIIILDKPIHRKYQGATFDSKHNQLQLNRHVSSYKEASSFLRELGNTCSLDETEVFTDSVIIEKNGSVEQLKTVLRKLIRDDWASTIRKQSLDIQRDARFQKLLSISLEIFVMHRLHDRLYYFLSDSCNKRNMEIKNKIDKLVQLNVTPKELGVDKLWIDVSMPSAVVELAALDSYKGPFEKLTCMKATMDYIIAEMKSYMARKDFETKDLIDTHNLKTHLIDTDDLISLLLYVIIKCRPQKLYTDIYYVENFVWSISPHDEFSYTLVSFKSAIALLEQLDTKNFNKEKVYLKASDTPV